MFVLFEHRFRLTSHKRFEERTMDHTIEEHRKHRRYLARFNSSVSVDGKCLGEGVVLNLSLGGCRLMSGMHIPFGIPIEVDIRPDQHSPIYVPRAVVRWQGDSAFGLQFNELPEFELAALTRLLWTLRHEPGS
jgi:hypothetical protein